MTWGYHALSHIHVSRGCFWEWKVWFHKWAVPTALTEWWLAFNPTINCGVTVCNVPMALGSYLGLLCEPSKSNAVRHGQILWLVDLVKGKYPRHFVEYRIVINHTMNSVIDVCNVPMALGWDTGLMLKGPKLNAIGMTKFCNHRMHSVGRWTSPVFKSAVGTIHIPNQTTGWFVPMALLWLVMIF